MNSGLLRFATCTPVAFHANASFYTRDTGLICRELRRLGHECQVIMPLPAREDDLPTGELLRTPMNNLYSASWWRSLKLQAVVLYSWGDPRYTGIARAIRRAGLQLIIHFDSSGELHEHLQRGGIINKLKDVAINTLRHVHLRYAHAITTSRPCVEALARDPFYGRAIAARCREFPGPVNSCFQCSNHTRQPRIICTGSWQLPVKRARLMMQTLETSLCKHPTAQADICGTLTPELQAWHTALPAALHQRIHLHGHCSHKQLNELCNAACVSLCTSGSEGSHGASAEALCCGCSIVCPPRPLLRVVQWYTSRNSGTVATEDTAESLSDALLHELTLWSEGTRNAVQISTAWASCFQVDSLPRFLA